MKNPNVTKPLASAATSARRSGSVATYDCEWCGTRMSAIRASGETDKGVRQAFGLCPKCNTFVWSKPFNIEAPLNDQALRSVPAPDVERKGKYE